MQQEPRRGKCFSVHGHFQDCDSGYTVSVTCHPNIFKNKESSLVRRFANIKITPLVLARTGTLSFASRRKLRTFDSDFVSNRNASLRISNKKKKTAVTSLSVCALAQEQHFKHRRRAFYISPVSLATSTSRVMYVNLKGTRDAPVASSARMTFLKIGSCLL